MSEIAHYNTNNISISIVEKPGKRWMCVGDKTAYSAISTNPDDVYQPVSLTPQVEAERQNQYSQIHRALVLGCGGCTIPRFLSKRLGREIHVDVVEIEPLIVDICQKHFMEGIDRERLSFIIADGFHYVKECSETYDFVFVDMYVGTDCANGIMSEDFLADLHRICRPQSSVIINAYPKQTEEECWEWLERTSNIFSKSEAKRHEKDKNYYLVLRK